MGEAENTTSRDGQHVHVLTCVECGALSGLHARGWRGYRIDDPETAEPPALAFYCPACADREFGPRRRLGR